MKNTKNDLKRLLDNAMDKMCAAHRCLEQDRIRDAKKLLESSISLCDNVLETINDYRVARGASSLFGKEERQAQSTKKICEAVIVERCDKNIDQGRSMVRSTPRR